MEKIITLTIHNDEHISMSCSSNELIQILEKGMMAIHADECNKQTLEYAESLLREAELTNRDGSHFLMLRKNSDNTNVHVDVGNSSSAMYIGAVRCKSFELAKQLRIKINSKINSFIPQIGVCDINQKIPVNETQIAKVISELERFILMANIFISQGLVMKRASESSSGCVSSSYANKHIWFSSRHAPYVSQYDTAGYIVGAPTFNDEYVDVPGYITQDIVKLVVVNERKD